MHVDHPGIRPRLIYRGVRDDILEHAQAFIATAFNSGITVAALEVALRDETMPYAVQRMGERLDQQAPGVKDESGREGPSRSAGEAWTSEAQIVPSDVKALQAAIAAAQPPTTP